MRLRRERGLESLLETLVRTFSPQRTAGKGTGGRGSYRGKEEEREGESGTRG